MSQSQRRRDQMRLNYFPRFMELKNIYGVFNEPMIIFKAMNDMDLINTEKGSADGSIQYKTLLGRYLSN